MVASIATAVLFIFTHVHSGTTVATQEFYTMAQCQYVAGLVLKMSDVINDWCVNK